MQPKKPEPTVETVKEGLTKIVRDIGRLKVEVKALRDKLAEFIRDRDIHDNPRAWGMDVTRGESSETKQPHSDIQELRWEFKDTSNFEMPTRMIFAIAKDLDGALRDVRAARTEIEAIANNSDLRAEFKNWKGE